MDDGNVHIIVKVSTVRKTISAQPYDPEELHTVLASHQHHMDQLSHINGSLHKGTMSIKPVFRKSQRYKGRMLCYVDK